MYRGLIAAFVLCLSLGISYANAQDLPRWQLSKTCAEEPDMDACIAFEANAYSRLSGTWTTVLPELKKSCLTDAQNFGQQSYRLLEMCLEDEVHKARAKAREEAAASG